ncbi:MAG: helix-turn-helix domain-containing protein [Clostridium sp.]|uniref:helix-turn-helix domain-containing protein n=1 Tax=Clostridium sp. TaxID=1506 RepID=UPI003D6C97E1
MEKDIRNGLGPNIKFYRNRMGITQEELSILLYNEGIKINRSTLAKIENKTRRLYDLQIIAFAKILQVEYKELFDDVSE